MNRFAQRLDLHVLRLLAEPVLVADIIRRLFVVELPLTPDTIHGHYELSEVKFSYGDNPPALVLPKLSIQSGERIVLLGPIGAGKSSLLRLLSGMYQPQQGRVLIDGQIGRASCRERVSSPV